MGKKEIYFELKRFYFLCQHLERDKPFAIFKQSLMSFFYFSLMDK